MKPAHSDPALTFSKGYAAIVSPLETFVAYLGREVVIADLVERKQMHSLYLLKHPSHVTFSADESLLAVKSTWGEIAIVKTDDGKTLSSMRPRKQDEGAAIHFSPCSQYLVEGSWSGDIRVRDVATLSITKRFAYEGEMVVATSPNFAADSWVFAHQPKQIDESTKVLRPYLSCWNWPLTQPQLVLNLDLDHLYAASQAPSAQYIAVVGSSRSCSMNKLHVLSKDGELLASSPVSLSGTRHSISWSRDSTLVGYTAANEFLIFDVPALNIVTRIPDAYPADIAFFNSNKEAVLASWKKGRIVNLF